MAVIYTLKKALNKATKRGYEPLFDFVYESGKVVDGKNYYAIIFDKDFCKSIWGEEKTFLPFSVSHPQLGIDIELWKWHLKNMVVSDSPINYLEDNLELDSWDKVLKLKIK